MSTLSATASTLLTGRFDAFLMKNVLSRIFAFWALLTFMLTFFIIFLPAMLTYLFPEPRSTDLFIRIARFWMRIWLPLAGCRIKVTGTDFFQKGQTYIVTCNHNSMMDVPLSSPFIPGPNRTIAKKSLARIPLFGAFYRKGSVLVDRKNESSRKESYLQMKKVLAKGIHMCIYPEGTRNKTGNPLAPFHGGAFRLALDTQRSIIPAVILNTRKALPPEKTFAFLPQPLEIHFLSPVEVKEGDTADRLRERTYKKMLDFLNNHS